MSHNILIIELKERSYYLCVSSVIEILTSAYSTIYQKMDQFSRNALMITKMSNLVHLLFSYYFWFVLSILLSTMIYQLTICISVINQLVKVRVLRVNMTDNIIPLCDSHYNCSHLNTTEVSRFQSGLGIVSGKNRGKIVSIQLI